MKGQDIVVLLKLISLHNEGQRHERGGSNDDDVVSIRGLANSLEISKSEISLSLNRSLYSGLAQKDLQSGRPAANRRALCDFMFSGLKYVFPVHPGPLVRGLPTSFHAPMLQGRLLSQMEYPFVWPHAKGEVKGQAIEPLFKSIPVAVQRDAFLYQCLALVDAIRTGAARETRLAQQILKERLGV
ncbi:hypothetical protein [Thalassospira sp. MCCC 1A02491]|uniref:hypothetical protein n=1 Tax=Thalassospira sp. MCCC 1A02491 TaxID=1769751 RepID=UPI0007AD6E19|nr:hypothetical protein [Thalassospira sp. MCCC 1A02491]KZB67192.1 hypothetical protein AUQ42_12950 [Thalassospira sp. MCCC 1A02491]